MFLVKVHIKVHTNTVGIYTTREKAEKAAETVLLDRCYKISGNRFGIAGIDYISVTIDEIDADDDVRVDWYRGMVASAVTTEHAETKHRAEKDAARVEELERMFPTFKKDGGA